MYIINVQLKYKKNLKPTTKKRIRTQKEKLSLSTEKMFVKANKIIQNS